MKRKRIGFVQMSMILFVVIVLGSWAYLIIKNDDLFEVFNERNLGFMQILYRKCLEKEQNRLRTPIKAAG